MGRIVSSATHKAPTAMAAAYTTTAANTSVAGVKRRVPGGGPSAAATQSTTASRPVKSAAPAAAAADAGDGEEGTGMSSLLTVELSKRRIARVYEFKGMKVSRY